MEKSTKIERLKSKDLIDCLFSEGKTIKSFPLSLQYLETQQEISISTIKVGVSVSKRNFNKAVDRNRIKRLLREAFKLNHQNYFNNSTTQCALMILYIGNEKPNFKLIDSCMKNLMEQFLNKAS